MIKWSASCSFTSQSLEHTRNGTKPAANKSEVVSINLQLSIQQWCNEVNKGHDRDNAAQSDQRFPQISHYIETVKGE